MTDVLIRDVPEEELKLIDARAAAYGVSRNEFLRRQIHQEAEIEKRLESSSGRKVTLEDLRRVAEICRDARDPDFKRRAWSCSDDD